ncbi:MAG TPA: hypothetical protein PKB11_14840 [Desulfovibrio sp.]|jgi:hypothetical protein|uniref:hypothetical protein n=1 Tax=Desulfovibrio sp. TaxID=885 RepID=UPI002A43C390|nr:hypothetical protein [Desulfovibrio sp.]MDY0307664.1 hypothetical protein [Desulfovibrionaceae bacterium]HMM40032.1 hypothetical protein [Desulfovibrio sp.]
MRHSFLLHLAALALPLCALLGLLAPARPCLGGQTAAKPPRIAGTFSQYSFTKDAADLDGLELRIVPVPGGYQAVIQEFEREPLALVLADVDVDRDRVSFSFRQPDGPLQTFQGVIAGDGIRGTMRVEGQAKPRECFLARATGVVWDQPVSAARKEHTCF